MSSYLLERVNAISWERDPEYSKRYPAQKMGWDIHDTLFVWIKTLSPEEKSELVQEIAELLKREIVEKGITKFGLDYDNLMNIGSFGSYMAILGSEKFCDLDLVVAMCEKFWQQNRSVPVIGLLRNVNDKEFAEDYILEMMERVFENVRSENGRLELLFDMESMGQMLAQIMGARVFRHLGRFIRFDQFKMVSYGVVRHVIMYLVDDKKLRREAGEAFKAAKSQLTQDEREFVAQLFQDPRFLWLLGEDALRCLGEEKLVEIMKNYEREESEKDKAIKEESERILAEHEAKRNQHIDDFKKRNGPM